MVDKIKCIYKITNPCGLVYIGQTLHEFPNVKFCIKKMNKIYPDINFSRTSVSRHLNWDTRPYKELIFKYL